MIDENVLIFSRNISCNIFADDDDDYKVASARQNNLLAGHNNPMKRSKLTCISQDAVHK